MGYRPIKFISEVIEPIYYQPPLLEKKPGCPNAFIWRGKQYPIIQLLSEWHDYQRRGRAARNMQPQHAAVASRRGSWGVGRDYFRVLTQQERIFDIYFDRAPVNVDNRKGAWFVDKELEFVESNPG